MSTDSALSPERRETCKCHAQLCGYPGCGQCSRCGCKHDGATPSRVVQRKRGERGPGKRKVEKSVPARAANQYQRGDLYESPLTPSGGFQLFSAFSSSNPAVRTMARCGTVSEVLTAFGLRDQIEGTAKHIPSAAERQDPATWQRTDAKEVRAAKAIILEVFRRICAVFAVNNADATEELLESLMHGNDQEYQISSADTSMMRSVGELYTAARRGSVEKRVLRATLCLLPRRKVFDECSSVEGFSLSEEAYTQARRDGDLLKVGSPIIMEERSVQRFDDADVRYAVNFILSSANVSFLSWGVKRVKLDGKWAFLPSISRRKSKTRIFDAYDKAIPATLKPLSRSTFFRVVSRITAGDAVIRKAVDYVVGFLVNDSVSLLKRIIPRVQGPRDMEEMLLADIEVINAYLKYGFDTRVKRGDPCLLHDIEYALSPETPTARSNERVPLCQDCGNVFAFFERIKGHLRSAGAPETAIRAVEDCASKARLYLGHRLRVLNQQAALAKMAEEIKQRTVSTNETTEAIVLIDFKMKLEPIWFREQTVQHYGKRGMTWHGALVQYYENELGANGEFDVVEHKLYYDHLSSGDNKQDRECVLSMVEAVLIRLRTDLPNVKRIVLQSDNAPSYQNVLLALVLPYLAAVHDVEIYRFIHTETQDGKSILDAHFAKAMAVLLAWVKEGFDCSTPVQASIGLNAHGGLLNTVIEIVDHDREQLKELVAQAAAIEKAMKRFVTRANDIFISTLDTERIRPRNYQACAPFTLTVFQYSGIGTGLKLLCDPRTGQCTVRSGSPATEESEYNVIMNSTMDAETEVEARRDERHEDDAEEDEDEENCDQISEEINVGVRVGEVTGVTISTQGQLRRRSVRSKTTRRLYDDSLGKEKSDIVAFATRIVAEMDVGGELFSQDAGGSYTLQTVTDRAVQSEQVDCFEAGWAVRPKRGAMYGQRYISNFREEIKEMFNRGVTNKALKLGPARMLEELQIKYPDRYDLPTENEIRQEISKLFQKDKLGDVAALSRSDEQSREDPLRAASVDTAATGDRSTHAESTRVGRHPQSKAFTSFFVRMFGLNENIKLKDASADFKANFPDSGLTDQQIQNKFQNTRTSLKRKRDASS